MIPWILTPVPTTNMSTVGPRHTPVVPTEEETEAVGLWVQRQLWLESEFKGSQHGQLNRALSLNKNKWSARVEPWSSSEGPRFNPSTTQTRSTLCVSVTLSSFPPSFLVLFSHLFLMPFLKFVITYSYSVGGDYLIIHSHRDRPEIITQKLY